ncbi:hypothetical protein, conserved [Eimeria brunetti]|uniref:ELM2 domain-containing protein n=1 Tax=Eimeria brunetti TaxID=51314 RepID=U6LGM5_9EIME|nr:hypothetical protein, conserved [Eimeria brunetti]
MGILSSPPSDSAVAATADAAAAAAGDASGTEKSAGKSPAAETANTSVPSGATEMEAAEPCTQHDPSDEERHPAGAWGSSSSEKQNAAEAHATGVHEFENQSAPGSEQQQHEAGTVKTEVSAVPCAACGKEQVRACNNHEGKPALCEACSRKVQSDCMQSEQHEEEPFQPSRQKEEIASAATASLEDTGTTPQRRHGQAETTDETTAKTPAAARSSSSGSSAASSRVRGASGAASAAGAATAGAGTTGSASSSSSGAATLAVAPRKCIDEGSVRRHVVPVGPGHQVPCLPPFFLDNEGFGCCCGEPLPALDPSLTAKLVYSPSSLERVRQRRLAEGLADRAICTEGDMEAFMQQCAKNWKGSKPGWQPFSPEFAFKLLHYAGYDPAKALQLMEDPQFSFQLVCDGPVRRYDNKWRPKDRRGTVSQTPYPTQVFPRGYLSRRHYRDSTGYSLR